MRSQDVMGMEGSGWAVLAIEQCCSVFVVSEGPSGSSVRVDSMIRVENFFLIEINVCAR